MGKGDVTLKFDAQTAAFVQSIMAAREKLEVTASSARKMGDEVVKAGDKASDAMKNMKNESQAMGDSINGFFGKFVGTFGSIAAVAAAGMKVAMDGQNNMLKLQEQKAADLIAKTQSITQSLAGSGQVAAESKVQFRLHEMARTKGYTEKGLAEAFSVISTRTGARVTVDDKLKATEAAMLAKATGMNEEAAFNVGANFAEFSRERRKGGAFEGATDEELRLRAKETQIYKPGGLSDKDLRFYARSQDKDQALRVLYAAAQSDESSRGLASIQQIADEKMDPLVMHNLDLEMKQHPKSRTEENQRKMKLFQLQQSGQDVMTAMLNDPSLAPAADRLAIKNLQEGTKRLKPTTSFEQDIAIRLSTEDEASRLARASKKNDKYEQGTLEIGQDEAADKEVRKKAIIAKIRRLHPRTPDWLAEKDAHMQVEWNARPTFSDAVDAGEGNGRNALNGPDDSSLPAALSPGMGIVDLLRKPPTTQPTAGQSQHLQVLNKIHDQISEQTSTLRTRRDTTLSNNDQQPGAR